MTLDEEVGRRVGWFVTNRRLLAEHLKCRRVIMDISNNVLLKYGDVGQLVSVQPMVRPGDPCVCGSGRKWKKCCEQKLEAEG